MSGNQTPSIHAAEHIGPVQTGDNIEAKRTAGYVWNPISSSWQRQPAPLTSGLALILDDTSTLNIKYIGKADAGAVSSAATWQIQKIDQTSGLTITWADGNTNFDNAWDNRTSLSYS